MRRAWHTCGVIGLAWLAGCASDPTPQPSATDALPAASSATASANVPVPPAATPATPAHQAQPASPGPSVFAPHVRLDRAARRVEFDAVVPNESDDPRRRRVFLEVIACTPDTRAHEAVLTTQATPSHLHAALLLIGLTPGKPGAWEWHEDKIRPVPPTGDPVRVVVRWESGGQQREADPARWVRNSRTDQLLDQTGEGFVFAGSVFTTRGGRQVYAADYDGTILGLHTFGFETIAWTGMYNPDESAEEPVWELNAAEAPPRGTAVVVELSPRP